MNYFRQHWYRIGAVLAVIGIIALVFWYRHLSDLQIVLSISLISLFLHQFEEYQFPGQFPRMINTVMFKSDRPDRFPLNANTAWIINVLLGWALYALALICGAHALWLATAAITVSMGNIVAHVILFNVKGKTFYNPGMITAIFLFVPIVIYYFVFLVQHDLLHTASLIAGLILGALINYFGIVKLITILGDEDSPYRF